MVGKSLNTQKNAAGGNPAAFVPKQGAASRPETQSAGKKPKKPKKQSGTIYKANEYLKKRFCTEGEIIGVEIQPDTIRLCQARAIDGKWEIVKFDSSNVLNNYQHDSLKKNKSLYAKSLKELFEKNKIENTSVALAIPVTLAIIKTVSLPLMPKENLERATRIPSFWQNLVQISDNLSEYSIYYRIVKENPASKEMDVLFIAAKNEDLKTYTDIAKEAGLEPCVIDIGCFSINNISKLKSDETADQQVLLKIGRDENYLQVLDHGKPYIYDLFVSDNEKSYLNEFLENQIFQQRFISQLNHIISKHEDKYKAKISNIQVISSEANIDKFINALKSKIENIDISIIDLLQDIKMPGELINNEEFQKTKSSYAVCIGLATRKLNIFDNENKEISETVNLLPQGDEIIKALKAKFYSKLLMWMITLLCIVSIASFSLFSVFKFTSDTAKNSSFNELNAQYKEKQKASTETSSKSGNLNRLIKIKQSLYPNQAEVLKAITEISTSIPEGVWVEELNFSNDGKITIIGRAFEEKGILSFSKEFDKSETIVDVVIASLKSTAMENGSLVKEFVINGIFKTAKENKQKILMKASEPEQKSVVQPQTEGKANGS